jgi:hypothetical protein
MPLVLTTNATITCPHGGVGTTIPSHPKWTINGAYVCVEQDPGTLTCIYCVSYTLQSMGLNATTIDDRKVILVTDINKSVTGLPLLITDNHPVNDQSTPAPIPPGQQAPPVSEEMADLVAPSVIAVPPTTPFKITPPPPPVPVVVTFSLTATHPMQWFATLIQIPLGGAAGQHFDLTNGITPNVSLVPSGGDWTTPSLTVTVTMLPPFVSSLGPGNHELYMTGVTKRGLSGYGKSIVAVTP